MKVKQTITSLVAVAGLSLMMSTFAGKLQVQTEEECVKSKAGHNCAQQVFAHAKGDHKLRIHCGDSVVYGTIATKELIKAHIEEGRNVILVDDGDYKDGYCY